MKKTFLYYAIWYVASSHGRLRHCTDKYNLIELSDLIGFGYELSDFLLINVKMPTIVGILIFIIMITKASERVKARHFFICRTSVF